MISSNLRAEIEEATKPIDDGKESYGRLARQLEVLKFTAKFSSLKISKNYHGLKISLIMAENSWGELIKKLEKSIKDKDFRATSILNEIEAYKSCNFQKTLSDNEIRDLGVILKHWYDLRHYEGVVDELDKTPFFNLGIRKYSNTKEWECEFVEGE